MTATDIVIVNWNAGPQLAECVASVRAYRGRLVGKCIVVDNGSSDGSADFLNDADDVEVVRTGTNLGFAKACNVGAERGKGEFILFLNPDARLFERSLTGAIEFLRNLSNKTVGIVGVQLVGDDGLVQRTCARFPSPGRLLAKSSGLASIFKSLDFQMREWPHDKVSTVDQVIGAFFVVRRHLFEQLDGFDERFFVYFEEVDLSRRLSGIGFRSVYLADVQAFHKGGGVSEQVKSHRLFYSLRSRILYAFKHFSYPSALVVALVALAVEPVSRLVFLCARRRWREIPDLLKGYRMLWGWVFARLSGARA